jgi:hypothetical protein
MAKKPARKLTADYCRCNCEKHPQLLVAAEYKEAKKHFVKGYGHLKYGNWYEILICPACEKAVVRIRYYHEGLSEEEWPLSYKTISPSIKPVKRKPK